MSKIDLKKCNMNESKFLFIPKSLRLNFSKSHS